jgi:hypothetical protein
VATTYMGVLVITKRRGIGNDKEGGVGCWGKSLWRR